jgi:hypothetical protein
MRWSGALSVVRDEEMDDGDANAPFLRESSRQLGQRKKEKTVEIGPLAQLQGETRALFGEISGGIAPGYDSTLQRTTATGSADDLGSGAVEPNGAPTRHSLESSLFRNNTAGRRRQFRAQIIAR